MLFYSENTCGDVLGLRCDFFISKSDGNFEFTIGLGRVKIVRIEYPGVVFGLRGLFGPVGTRICVYESILGLISG